METGPASAQAPIPTGLAHVATVSFLASRVSPSGQFWLAIAGGVALARASATAGWRTGYGVGLAAMLQTTALIGPARVNGPLTQALTAPMLGRLHHRGTPLALQLLACFGIRLAHYLVLVVFFVWIILGGLDAFTGSYDTLTGWLGFLPQGERAALVATGAVYAVAAVFYSGVQVAVYRRALRDWPAIPLPLADRALPETAPARDAGTYDPRAATLAAVVASALLLTTPAWPLLAGVAAWLALATLTCRPDPQPLRLGLALAVLLTVGAFAAAMLADLGPDEAARRATRAALLVLVATWLRAAAGADGMREVFARGLHHLRWLPSVREAGAALDGLDPRGSVTAAGRELVARLNGVPAQPLAVADAVVGWVASETAGFRRVAPSPAAQPRLRLRRRDVLLIALAAAPVLAPTMA